MLLKHALIRPSRHSFRLGSLSATMPWDAGYLLKMTESFKNDYLLNLMNAVIRDVRRTRAHQSFLAD